MTPPSHARRQIASKYSRYINLHKVNYVVGIHIGIVDFLLIFSRRPANNNVSAASFELRFLSFVAKHKRKHNNKRVCLGQLVEIICF